MTRHAAVKDRRDDVEKVVIETQAAGLRSTDRITVPCPIGHRERRSRGVSLLQQKITNSVPPAPPNEWLQLEELTVDQARLAATPVDDFMALLVA